MVILYFRKKLYNIFFSFFLFLQLFCFIASCVLHKHQNIAITGLECLQHLLQTSNADFIHWLTSSNIDGQVWYNVILVLQLMLFICEGKNYKFMLGDVALSSFLYLAYVLNCFLFFCFLFFLRL